MADEFLINNPAFPRLNFSRDVLVLGGSYYLTVDLRLYAEAGWAFDSDGGMHREFQFGIDYSPVLPQFGRVLHLWLSTAIFAKTSISAETSWPNLAGKCTAAS